MKESCDRQASGYSSVLTCCAVPTFSVVLISAGCCYAGLYKCLEACAIYGMYFCLDPVVSEIFPLLILLYLFYYACNSGVYLKLYAAKEKWTQTGDRAYFLIDLKS